MTLKLYWKSYAISTHQTSHKISLFQIRVLQSDTMVCLPVSITDDRDAGSPLKDYRIIGRVGDMGQSKVSVLPHTYSHLERVTV